MDKDNLIATLKQIKALAENALKTIDGKSTARAKVRRSGVTRAQTSAVVLSFSLNPGAFMKKYAIGLGGPRKFTLLLARLSQGKVGKEISVEQITSTWNKMKSVLGGPFNGAYATRAKHEGWIDSPKQGVYMLSQTWKEVNGSE